jgi:hypothetical protein
MKNSKQDGLVTVIHSSDNAFVKSLSTIYVKEIILEVVERAKDDATKNLPSSSTKSSIHTDFLTTRFNRIVIDHKSSVENSQQQYHANKDISEFKKFKKRLVDKLNTVVNTLRIKGRSIENLKSFQQKIVAYQKAFFGIVLLSASEAIFASTSFQIFVSNLLFSLIIGLTFAVALYYSAVVGTKVLKLARNRYQFMGIFFVILTIIGVVFYTLGYFRLIFLNEMSDDANLNYHLSPLQFMLIQLFFYTCAILLKYFYLPEKSEFEQYHNWRKAKRDIGKLEKQKKQLEDNIREIEQSLKQSLITRRTLISHSADTELKIDAHYKDAYQHYIKSNLHHRSDNSIPLCFQIKNNIPELTLFFQDKKLLEFNEADLDDE